VDADHALLEVDVCPPEGEKLATAEPADARDDDRVTGFRSCLVDQLRDLFPCRRNNFPGASAADA
jgi:hypothetical protein